MKACGLEGWMWRNLYAPRYAQARLNHIHKRIGARNTTQAAVAHLRQVILHAASHGFRNSPHGSQAERGMTETS